MAVKDVQKDPANRALVVTAEFDAPVEKVWQLWADPRKLERWWGPPSFPATFVKHEFVAGGKVSYFMTSPEGERHYGYWDVISVDAPQSVSLHDGFANDDSGAANDAMPACDMNVTLSDREGGGTVMVMRTVYPTVEAMEQMLAMGMEEGLTLAMGQMDALL
ncbi:MAG: SRPBCC domain-containing protein [Acidimicrobiia bacterium]